MHSLAHPKSECDVLKKVLAELGDGSARRLETKIAVVAWEVCAGLSLAFILMVILFVCVNITDEDPRTRFPVAMIPAVVLAGYVHVLSPAEAHA